MMIVVLCRKQVASRKRINLMSSEMRVGRLMSQFEMESCEMTVGDMEKKAASYLRNRTLAYTRHGERKHIDINQRIEEINTGGKCCERDCLHHFVNFKRQFLAYQIARWDDMTRAQKSSEVFHHSLRMRACKRAVIEQQLATGYRTSKSGALEKIHPRDVKYIENGKLAHSLFDPVSKTDVPLCMKALQTVTGSFSGSLMASVNELLDRGCEQYYTEYSFARRSREGTKSATVISWVEHQMHLIGDAMPNNDQKMWLPYDDWSSAHKHYSQQITDGMFGEWGIVQPAGLSLFRKIVKVHFKSHIRFAKKYNTFTKCNTCSDYKIQLKRAGVASVSGKVWQKYYFRHLMWQALCRIKYHLHRTKAKSFPHKVLSLIFDGSDNHSFEIPFCGDKRKDWGGLDKPKTRSTGVLVHSDSTASETGGLRLYITDERTKKGTNFNITVLIHALLAEKEARGGKLPPYLYIQMDSAGDNKSKTMARFCEYLVKTGVFMKVKVCMLPVGHTHEDIDAGFGRLNRKFVESGTVTQTTKQGLERAQAATAATRSLVWIKVGPCCHLFVLLCVVSVCNTDYFAKSFSDTWGSGFRKTFVGKNEHVNHLTRVHVPGLDVCRTSSTWTRI